jgi:hypothetical protein
MPDSSPFNVTGFVPPGRAYRLLGLGATPPTPIGHGRQTSVALVLAVPNVTLAGTSKATSGGSASLTP